MNNLRAIDLLKLMTNYAKRYSPDAVESVKRNSHMNDLTPTSKVDKEVVDAVLVDFINFIGVNYCIDYALCTGDLNGPIQEDRFS